jgi:hypothetical protein
MGAPGTIAGSTLQVNTNSLVPTQTLINIYTLTVQDMNNSCANQSVIPIYQNTFKPIPGISTGGNTTITCASPTIILTNTSSSGIPIGSGFPVHLVVSSYLWEGPAPVPPAAMSSTYIVYTAGTYTMFIKDLNNGCTASKTVNITGGCNLVGLEDNLNNTLSVYMYPNPTKGIVTLQSNYSEKNIVVELYNSLGMLVKKQLLQAPESHLNFSECASGIYFVYLKDKDVVLHRAKLIKE